MSNRVCIQPTVFKNYPDGEESYGVRVFDDYEQAYDNYWDKIPDDDMEVLKLVVKSDDEKISAMLDFVKEGEYGIYIGNNWYDWDDIKNYL